MNIILENIIKALNEGRIEDAKKKFNPEMVDYFVKGDPSGNNKYLEWLVSAMNHRATVSSINREILGINSDEPLFDTAEFLMKLVKKFHELLPYMVYEEDGKKIGTTDLYQYKFTDSDMIHYLAADLNLAKERKDEREKEKNAKKNSDKIYNDANWLVVRPKTWESSCVYGAGTQWCTTNKKSDSHFNRETDRNFLIYVIDKTKSSSNDLYKVAWQIPYVRNVVKKYVNKYTVGQGLPGTETSTWDFDLKSGIKLWNAKDNNIVRSTSGIEYMESVSMPVKQAILNYMKLKMEKMYENMAYVDDPYMQALVEMLTISEEDVENIDETRWRNYGLKVYEYDGQNYAIGIDDEVERAKYEWARNYVEDVGAGNATRDLERYVSIRYPRDIARDMASSYIEDQSDEDLIEEAKRLKGKAGELAEEFEINSGITETNQEEIDEMWERYSDLTEEEELELKELEKENESIEKHKEKLINDIRALIESDYEDDLMDRLENDPLDWLWEMGYYDKKNGTFEKGAFDYVVDIDEDKLIDDIARDSDYDIIGEYDEITVDGVNYFIFKI